MKMKESKIQGWVDYNGSIVYVYYSEEKKGYLQNGDDVNIINREDLKRIRLDDSRISHFRIVPSLSEITEKDGINEKETIDCFLEESFDYKGKEHIVADILKKKIIEYVDELQEYLSKQNELVVDY
jgi:hypothetical protein